MSHSTKKKLIPAKEQKKFQVFADFAKKHTKSKEKRSSTSVEQRFNKTMKSNSALKLVNKINTPQLEKKKKRIQPSNHTSFALKRRFDAQSFDCQ